MAKYECSLTGDFDTFLNCVDKGIMGGSMSATFEDGSDFNYEGIRCAVRVYERFSAIGSNRVSLSITVIGSGQNIYLSAIPSGGSQAVFFKVNRWGEDAFLSCLTDIVQRFDSSTH